MSKSIVEELDIIRTCSNKNDIFFEKIVIFYNQTYDIYIYYKVV